MAAAMSLCTFKLFLRKQTCAQYLGLRPVVQLGSRKPKRSHLCPQSGVSIRRLVVLAITEDSTKSSELDERIPSWARPDSDEPPPWARDEGNENSESAITIPFFAYLLASAVTAIAAKPRFQVLYTKSRFYRGLRLRMYIDYFAGIYIGSIFEYVNQKPVFGVLNSDSVFYAPLLGFFVFTGIPMSAFLWFKSVRAANKEAEEQDRRDGYL